ncbi:MAG: glycosyl hydrolase [Opitutaceae bacterium]|nr:glycosyl hydrolase [Opitutaceae bacterium]
MLSMEQSVFRLLIFVSLFSLHTLLTAETGPIRVLFLGHEQKNHHRSDLYYPMLEQALGPDAIYFDYVTDPETALGNAEYLNRFDALLIYANHKEITPQQWKNLKSYVDEGGGFLPIHCASWCFQNEPGFDQLVGGRFAHHKTGVFSPNTIKPDHPAVEGVPRFKAWDETYVHINHNPNNSVVLQVREVAGSDDNIQKAEPWTWIRTVGKGKVFYTASGHDERVWNQSAFHELLKAGILWAVGDEKRKSYQSFVANRVRLAYEKRDNIPNYENRPEPLPFQFPLSPLDSMDYTRAPVGFKLELFAHEPDIINPICMAWDERGRLWVGESVDYPNELTDTRRGQDKIKILEDTDQDGKCDKVTVFATGLNIPTSITFSNGGIIVAHAPDFLFLKDTDGDDVVDVREILNTGWGIRDTHAGPSNLRYGFDNKIWGTVGYSGYRDPDVDEEDKSAQKFGQGVFSMNPDGSGLQFQHQFNNNTWGLGFNESGDVFGSTANNNPAFFCGFPLSGYSDSQGLSAKMIADSAQFHPITPNVRQVDIFGAYTAGSGYALANSNNFPESWRNSMAFIGGPTGHLLGMYQNVPDGSGYMAKNRFALLASADEWFSPVAAEVGPDGNLWVADWYNFIIQHNPTPTVVNGGYDAANGAGNAHVNLNRDRQHGRIYRLIWEGAQDSEIRSLSKASSKELVSALSNDNQFWRLTAQRLLVEKRPDGVLGDLKQLLVGGGIPAVHAFWALHGLEKMEKSLHITALMDKNPFLRKAAVSALGNSAEGRELLIDTAILADSDLGVRRAAFIALAHQAPDTALQALIRRLYIDEVNRTDAWLSIALKAAAANQSIQLNESILGPNLVSNSSFEVVEGGMPVGWILLDSKNYGETSLSFDGNAGNTKPRSGDRVLTIDADKGAEFVWYTKVKVKPDTDYRLATWIKVRSLREGNATFIAVRQIPSARSEVLKWRSPWLELEVYFNSGDKNELDLAIHFEGDFPATGKVSFDDFSLSEILCESKTDLVGDAKRGKTIFFEHEIASCSRCHKVNEQGGDVGPSLDGIASKKQIDYLRESLIDPQATIAEGFPVELSPMPPFGVLLEPQQLEDVLAYLKTLN